MTLDRRQLSLLSVALVAATPAPAALSDEEQVAGAVETFRKAQVDSDAKAFDALCLPELSYSHSDGRVEDKATFIKNATAGRYVFNVLEYRTPSIRVAGPAAVVRFNWLAKQTWTDGKVTDTNMQILMVWLKQGSEWKLLARAVFKV